MISSTPKRKILNINEKIELIKTIDSSPYKKKKDIAADFGIPVHTLSSIYSSKDKFLAQSSNSYINLSMKKIRPSSYPEIEEELLNWYIKDYASIGLSISGLQIRKKALEVAKKLGQTNFSASNGWIERFKARHNITAKNSRKKSKANLEKNGSNHENVSINWEDILKPHIELKEMSEFTHYDSSYRYDEKTFMSDDANLFDNVRTETESADESSVHDHSSSVSDLIKTISRDSLDFPELINSVVPSVEEADDSFKVLLQYVVKNERVTTNVLKALQELKIFLKKEKNLRNQTKITDYFKST